MKYGKVYNCENLKEAEKLIGKKVLFSDFYKAINDGDSRRAFIGKLDKIDDDPYYPFMIGCSHYQFVKEIIEEEPKYRPFTEDELKRQVGKVFMEKGTGSMAVATVFRAETGSICLARYSKPCNAQEFLDDWVFADDGAPCGVRWN